MCLNHQEILSLSILGPFDPDVHPGTHSLLGPDPGFSWQELGWETVCPSPWIGTLPHLSPSYKALVWCLKWGSIGKGSPHIQFGLVEGKVYNLASNALYEPSYHVPHHSASEKNDGGEETSLSQYIDVSAEACRPGSEVPNMLPNSPHEGGHSCLTSGLQTPVARELFPTPITTTTTSITTFTLRILVMVVVINEGDGGDVETITPGFKF